MTIRNQIILGIAFLGLAGFLPAIAQDNQRAPGELADEMAEMIFGEGNVPPKAGEATEPQEGCSEATVEVCVTQFLDYLDRLEIEATGSGLYSGGQYEMATLMSGAAACEYGDGRSCYLMATLYSDPPLASSTSDLGAAVKYYNAACELDYGAGCGAVAYYSRDAGLDTPAPDIAAIARKGCMLDDAASCTYYGFYASQGVGVEIDTMLTLAAFMKACDLSSATGCGNLGAMYEQGLFVPQSDQRASTYFNWGCEMGDGNSCTAIMRLHAEDGPLPDAARVAEAKMRACEIDAASCAE